MAPNKALLVLVAATTWPGLALAEKWTGKIQCTVLAGANSKALNGDFEMRSDGSKLTYSRPVHINDSSSLSGIDEIGHGSWQGDKVTLEGGATGPGFSYTASYKGGMDNGQLVLVGEQWWQAKKVQEPRRDCRIVLHRVTP